MMEYHHRRLAEFEAAENFASPAAARVALGKVLHERYRICEGDIKDTITCLAECPCRIHKDVERALGEAVSGNSDPWASTRERHAQVQACQNLTRGRNLSKIYKRSLHPEVAAEIAGRWMGKAYKYFLA